MQIGDLVKKVGGRMDNGVIGIIIDDSKHREEGFRRTIRVQTKKGIRKWFTHSIEVISESR